MELLKAVWWDNSTCFQCSRKFALSVWTSWKWSAWDCARINSAGELLNRNWTDSSVSFRFVKLINWLDSINRHWHRRQLQVGKNRRRTMSERNRSEWESVCLGVSGSSRRLDVRDLSKGSHHLSIFPSPSTHTVCSDSQSTCCSSNSADWAHEVWENSPSQGQEDFESHYHLHIC